MAKYPILEKLRSSSKAADTDFHDSVKRQEYHKKVLREEIAARSAFQALAAQHTVPTGQRNSELVDTKPIATSEITEEPKDPSVTTSREPKTPAA